MPYYMYSCFLLWGGDTKEMEREVKTHIYIKLIIDRVFQNLYSVLGA